MAGLRPMIIGLVVLTAFSFFIILYINGVLTIKNPQSAWFSDNFSIGASGLNNSVNRITSTFNSTYTKLSTSNPSPVEFVFLIFQNAFYIPIDIASVVYDMIATEMTILGMAFGGGAMGAGMATAIALLIAGLVITLVLLIIKFIRTGESER